MPDLITRRELLLATAFALFAGRVNATNDLLKVKRQHLKRQPVAAISRSEFQSQMAVLAKSCSNGLISQQAVGVQAKMYLTQLDTVSAEFQHAVDAAFESGNQYWLGRLGYDQ